MDVRHREVLIAVIREYVDSAEPVGSRVLAKRHFPNLSPATIRNAMADLEEMGYLARRSCAAGRGSPSPRDRPSRCGWSRGRGWGSGAWPARAIRPARPSRHIHG